MKLNNWFVPALIGAGLLIILISTLAPQSKVSLGFNKKSLAVLNEKTGSVLIHNNEMPVQAELQKNQELTNHDVIKTEDSAEALISFYNGGQFRIVEKSEVLLDETDSGTPLLVIRTGDIYIEKFGKPPGFSVRSNGQIYTSVDYALIDKKNASRLKEPIPQKSLSSQISQQEIESTLGSKRNDFFKCFGQLIQRNPQASGQVLVSFTIEKQGHTSKVEISKSEILDAGFKSCLIEVVSRTHFRAFEGSPVATVFPLKFE